MKRVLLLLVLVFGAAVAWAQTQCLEYSARTNVNAELTATGTTYGWVTSKSAACDLSARGHEEAMAAQGYGTIVGHYIAGDICYVTQTNPQTHQCTPNCTTVAYSGGFTSRTGTCAPDTSCTMPAGEQRTLNVTLGYQGSPPTPGGTGIIDYLPNGQQNTGGVPAVPSTMCYANCTLSVGAAGEMWASMQPTAAGMYRMSQDYTMTSTGAECVQSSDDKNLTDGTQAAPATCPGYQGYVNGRLACVPKTATSSSAKPSGAATTGNPKAGTPPGAPDRIPTVNGDGGNKGGPPHPSDGSKTTPDGTVITPGSSVGGSGTKTAVPGEEQLACGAPGQPKCAIDETGTPATKELKLDEAAITSIANSNRSTISGSGDKGMFGSWTGVFVTPPVVACSPTTWNMLNGQTVQTDPCPVVEGTRTVVGWLWALSGFWLCLGWIREAV